MLLKVPQRILHITAYALHHVEGLGGRIYNVNYCTPCFTFTYQLSNKLSVG